MPLFLCHLDPNENRVRHMDIVLYTSVVGNDVASDGSETSLVVPSRFGGFEAGGIVLVAR